MIQIIFLHECVLFCVFVMHVLFCSHMSFIFVQFQSIIIFRTPSEPVESEAGIHPLSNSLSAVVGPIFWAGLLIVVSCEISRITLSLIGTCTLSGSPQRRFKIPLTPSTVSRLEKDGQGLIIVQTLLEVIDD